MIVDPNAALERIIEAALEGNANELRIAAIDLGAWLDRGGRAPDHSALQRALSSDGGS